MSGYSRTTWEEAVTSLSAQNMNNIEDGVEEAIAKADSALTKAELNEDAIDQVYTKAQSDAKYRTISDSYTKSQLYTKTEADNKYRTISDSYSKGDFKVITLSKSLGMRAEGDYTDSLASYIDSADKYAVISAAMYSNTAPTSAAPLGQRWIYTMIDPVHDGSHNNLLSNAKFYVEVQLYNSGNVPYVKYHLYNPTNYPATVSLRLVLLKIA